MIGRITDDGRIVPVSVSEGLVPPNPWSPWLDGAGAFERQQFGLRPGGSCDGLGMRARPNRC
jgi:hypothetical protein